GQRKGSADLSGELNDVGTGVGLGTQDRGPQRPVAAVREVQDRKGARDGSIFEGFNAQPAGGRSAGRPSDRRNRRAGLGGAEKRAQPHGNLLRGYGLLYSGCGPHGAQTERRGGAGPVGGLLGGKDPTGRLFRRETQRAPRRQSFLRSIFINPSA